MRVKVPKDPTLIKHPLRALARRSPQRPDVSRRASRACCMLLGLNAMHRAIPLPLLLNSPVSALARRLPQRRGVPRRASGACCWALTPCTVPSHSSCS
eukprot:364917-Chlamydomonas_euryale.AAC.2